MLSVSRGKLSSPANRVEQSAIDRQGEAGRCAATARFRYTGRSSICWGLGTHLGDAAPQSYRRDRLGYVQRENDNPTRRGYLMDVDLRSHTDFHEVLCLACVRRSVSGGESGLASSQA